MLYYFVIVTITQKEYFSQSIDHLDGDYDSEVSIQELKNDEPMKKTTFVFFIFYFKFVVFVVFCGFLKIFIEQLFDILKTFKIFWKN